ncbi:death-associated protein kinase 1-like isoform X2 [Daktulosphaira vitifoliae]|uniref:death-associated protein kinase 1-like isoform X1 n=1 Tax=Daktulosphaira vitifoliae TaxID=58002 RepID=UPI0021AAAE37|nr:death-associated protein kinase 1-like isoform X1 [Daktulosphaira vitifoliae]XP_050522604.1 death-associated protein kinase 1-like isoform X2 [Daktulosphaira vitifoliae]
MKEVVSVNLTTPPPSQPQLIRAKQPGYLDLTTEQVDRLISKEPIDKDYEVEIEPFARGKYATVRRCRNRKTGKQYAAKFLRKRRRNADLRPEILHEVAVLEACTFNSRIVNLYKVFETTTEMILLLEMAPGGELQMVLDRDEVPSEIEVARLMQQILDGLNYLHTINVAHLDIKPQNLVLTADFPNCDVKLCDFGISRYLSEGVDVREILGTPDYVAPEVLNYEPIDVQTDMWSIGVLMYVLLTGCSPFGGDTKQETFCNISQCKLDFPEDLFQDISEDAIDLMKKLMVKNPRNRLTAKECLAHSWFQRMSTTMSRIPSFRENTTDTKPMKTPKKVDETDTITVVKQIPQMLLSKSCDNSPRPAMSMSRQKSFRDNMETLVKRLEHELNTESCTIGKTEDAAAYTNNNATTCRTLSRANGTQTMPVGLTKDIAPFTFRRVYVVDEPPQEYRPRAPSVSSTPNSSSADNSSISDCSSDTVSEFSIDSSSDRSSIISLEDSLDAWCRPLSQQTNRMGKMSTSCFNVWDAAASRRKWPKECSGAVARAMSQFASGDCKAESRLKVFDTRNEIKDKRCVGLELMRERNGNVVVIREIKANSGSRYARCSEVKCESVQSRIRRLQVHNAVQMEKSNIF